eukprot:1147943-Pelagomonas_calceolata.AAC.5
MLVIWLNVQQLIHNLWSKLLRMLNKGCPRHVTSMTTKGLGNWEVKERFSKQFLQPKQCAQPFGQNCVHYEVTRIAVRIQPVEQKGEDLS